MKTEYITIREISYKPNRNDRSKIGLKPINLELKSGDIHTILGEKESGKSIISSILRGTRKPTSGSITMNGRKIRRMSIKESRNQGIEVITEKDTLIDDVAVGELFYINSHIIKQQLVFHRDGFNRGVNDFLSSYDVKFTAETEVYTLNESEKFFLQVLMAVYCDPGLLILDEVLVKLTATDQKKASRILAELAGEGGIVLLLINSIDNIPGITTDLSVLRNGEIILTDRYGKLDKYNLVKILYRHVIDSDSVETTNREFYQMIKYNQAILKDLPVVLIGLDRDYTIKFLNHHGENYFQTSSAAVINKPLKAVLTLPEQSEEILKGITEGAKSISTRISCNSIQRIAHLTSFPITEEENRLGSILILNDTTEEEMLREQIMQNEKLASIGMLAAGVAHEINHPLGIIKNITEILKYSCGDKTLLDDVHTIENEIKVISQIISNLMGFSADENAPFEVFDIADTLMRVTRLLAFYSRKNGVAIEFESGDRIFEIYANKTDIRQVFLNLIRNGIEAMPDGGAIAITLGFSDEKEDTVRITLRDTGKGIDLENVEDIFLPFYSSKSDKSGGMGLGLYISYNKVRKYNGRISVESRVEEGTTFTIDFPLA